MRQRVRAALERFGATGGLIAVAVIWGGTFVVVAEAVARYPVYAFLFWRFLVAAVAFVALFPRVLGRLGRPNLVKGTIAGLFLTSGYVLQTFGLTPGIGTTAARAAFITGMYVVMVPLLQAIVLRRRPAGATIVGAVLALGGLWLLSGIGMGGSFDLGDILVLGCALAYSIHMLVLGTTDVRHDVAALTLVQIVVACVVTGALSLVLERPSVPTDAGVWAAIAITGVLASAVAFAVQTYAQRKMPPARVALILVMEPAFGGLFGWVWAGVFPLGEVLGAGLMLSGMVVSEVVAAHAPEAEHVAFEPAVEGMPAPVVERGSGGVDRP
ncbi:MAG: DMT family transporter [Coriobacteriales bacterium]|nr:DMT family transporter [Coriobacteriales bacterium]